jgi:sacsin
MHNCEESKVVIHWALGAFSDLPSILSGEGIGFLDPHEQFFKNGRYPTSSYLWNLKLNKDQIAAMEDQFSPYFQELFGVNKQVFEDGFFNGTVFRFPFRVEGMDSDLCQTTYNIDKVRDLFASFETDAHRMLLFLKNIEKIEIYEKMKSDCPPKLIMLLQIGADSLPAVSEKRAALVNSIVQRTSGSLLESVSVTFKMATELMKPDTDSKPRREDWIVSHYYGGQSDLDAEAGVTFTSHQLPWVAVALPASSTSHPRYLDPPTGHVFCFLPLPRENESSTGLRFHLHGYFAVDQNRRHIKMRTIEQKETTITDKDILWNEYIIKQLLPKALTNAIVYVATPPNSPTELLYCRDLIYSSIPEMALVKQEWKPLAESFVQNLPRLPAFFSPVGGGRFVKAKDALFDRCDDSSPVMELVRKILHNNGTDLVSVPNFLFKQLGSSARAPSATVVCSILKKVDTDLMLTDDERMTLLKYFVENISKIKHEIIGTRLLQLGSGSWIDFSHSDAEKIYIDSSDHSRTLLPGLDHLFVNVEAVETCRTLAATSK